jgi:hypothetical protein
MSWSLQITSARIVQKQENKPISPTLDGSAILPGGVYVYSPSTVLSRFQREQENY